MSIPGDGQWKMPYARWCQYRTTHRRGAGSVETCWLEHRLHSAEVLAEQKRVRDLLAQSRELLKQIQAG
jgi:hypothetical protein